MKTSRPLARARSRAFVSTLITPARGSWLHHRTWEFRSGHKPWREQFIDESVILHRAGLVRALQRRLRSIPELQTQPGREVVHLIHSLAKDGGRHSAITNEAAGDALPDPASVAPDDWLYLQRLLMAHGLFVIAGEFRQRARAAALHVLHECPDTSQIDVRLLLLLLEQPEQWNSVLELAADTLRHRLKADRPEVSQYLNLLGVGVSQIEPSRIVGDRWSSLIGGRRVAVVGPAPPGQQIGEQIDGHDLVIRANFRGPDQLGEPQNVGRRTDIAYFNNSDLRAVFDTSGGAHLEGLHAVVMKGNVGPSSPARALPNCKVVRSAWNPHSLLPAGEPNMLQVILFDVLAANPASIMVANANFFASPSAYDTKYRNITVGADGTKHRIGADGSTGIVLNRCLSFAREDIISNRCFTRNLAVSGHVEGDAMFDNALALSDREYLSVIDEHYGALRR